MLHLHKAGAVDAQPTPCGDIAINLDIDDVSPDFRGTVMDRDAQDLARVLCETMPQGTLDRLTLILMQRMVTDIIGPAHRIGRAT